MRNGNGDGHGRDITDRIGNLMWHLVSLLYSTPSKNYLFDSFQFTGTCFKSREASGCVAGGV